MSNKTSIDIPSYKKNLEKLVDQPSEMLPEEALETFSNDVGQLAPNHQSPLIVSLIETASMFLVPLTQNNGQQIFI